VNNVPGDMSTVYHLIERRLALILFSVALDAGLFEIAKSRPRDTAKDVGRLPLYVCGQLNGSHDNRVMYD